MKIEALGAIYEVSDDVDKEGYHLVTDEKGARVGLVSDDPDKLVVVPHFFEGWENPHDGPRGRVLLHVRDAWRDATYAARSQ